MNWQAGDQIRLVWNGGSAVSSALAAGGSTATFSFTIPDAVTPVYGVSPSGVSTSYDGSTFVVTVPALQDGCSCGDADISVSQLDGYGNLAFKHLGGLLKVSTSDASVRKIVITAHGGKTIAGDAEVSFSAGLPVIGAVGTPSSTVTLSVSGAGDYYAALLPSDMDEGFLVELYDGSDVLVGQRRTAKRLNLARRDVVGLGTIAPTRYYTKTGTLVRTSVADPCMNYVNGTFWLTMTGSANIALIHDTSLSNLTTSAHSNASNLVYRSASDPNVEALYGAGAEINGTWSPEIHYLSSDDAGADAGWYMYFGLRKKSDDSRYVRPVLLKSSSGTIAGPYVHPVSGTSNETMTLQWSDGTTVDDWVVGPSILRIPSGAYQGLYLMWVDEVGRGEGLGNFYQRLRIARLTKPWKLATAPATITQPTQSWEKKGANSTLPQVVEGCTAIYGDHGEIFVAYCGSGYWSEYGLGQLTLKQVAGDYANPLETSSWIKYSGNPVFSSQPSSDLRGAGHAFFFKDDVGTRFMCYHAYPYVDGVKQSSRNAYVETYTIDYDSVSETAPQGVLKFGLLGTGVSAPVSTSEFDYYKTIQ